MFNFQKFTKGIIINIFRRGYSSSPKTSILAQTSNETNGLKNEETPSTTNNLKTAKNPMVAAAFASLNDEVLTTNFTRENTNVENTLNERINNASSVNGLLSITEINGPVPRKEALKIVSILAEWSSINRISISEFENDSRFLKLCRILGRTVPRDNVKNNISNNNNNIKANKITGFRTDDLSTVLGVTGDDEAAKLIASITLPQMVKVMSTLASKKRRSTPLLRSLAYNISSHANNLDLKQCGDILYAAAVLNFPDSVLLSRICSDVQSTLLKNEDKSAVVGSILTSLGLLKYREPDVLEALSNWILKHSDICRPSDISSLFLTLASLNYTPVNIDQLKDLVIGLSEVDFKKSSEWLNHVWALTSLGYSNSLHYDSVLKNDFIGKLTTERRGDLTPTIKMKLLNINAAAKFFLKDYKGATLTINNEMYTFPIMHSKSKQKLVNGMLDTLKSLVTSDNLLQTNVDTKMGFIIDAVVILDAKCNPLPFNKEHLNSVRVAIMMLDYHDICHGTQQTPNGVVSLTLELLKNDGYKILTIPHNEFNTSEKLLKRVQYLEKRLKESCK